MICKIANRGTSFKGAAAYYLHDKKADTAERVEWTATRNVQTDDPERALRYMAFTAMDKDRLKAQAGVSNAGQKSKGDVYSYSLAWHPNEQGKFDKTQMLDAADQSLKALGAQDHQAVIVAHNDEDHPHIHVIVNMVNPENGKNLNVSNDRSKSHKWSNEYRKQRGEEHLYTPNKAKKFEAIEAKNRGEKVEYHNKGKSIPRGLNKVFEAAKATVTPTEAQAIKKEEATKDKALGDYGRKLQSKHSNQWAALSDNYQLRKKNISKQYFQEKDSTIEAIKAQNKPAFKDLARQQWIERTKFEGREKRLGGKIKNVHDAIKHARATRGDKNKSLFAMVKQFSTGKARRSGWLNKVHKQQLNELRGAENRSIKDAVSKLNKSRQRRYTSARQDFSFERKGLIGSQNAANLDLKNRWNVRHDERKKIIDTLKRTGKVKEKDSELLTASDKAFAKALYRENLEKEQRKRTPTATRSEQNTDEGLIILKGMEGMTEDEENQIFLERLEETTNNVYLLLLQDIPISYWGLWLSQIIAGTAKRYNALDDIGNQIALLEDTVKHSEKMICDLKAKRDFRERLNKDAAQD